MKKRSREEQIAINKSNQADWQRKTRRAFVEKHGYSMSAHYATGGLRGSVLARDDYKCVKCGMSDDLHKDVFNRPITVDHKDKNRKNNTMENLQTLCLRCHGSKDMTKFLKDKKMQEGRDEALQMRSQGKTYQEIADRFGVCLSTAWIHTTSWEKEKENGCE